MEIKEGGRDGEVPENKMNDRIRSLYVRTVQEENQGEKISKKTQEEINGLLKEWERGGNQNGEEFEDKILLAACAAEENGFVMGIRYAFRLFSECMQE